MAIVLQTFFGESSNNAGQGFAKVQIGNVAVFESLSDKSFVVGPNPHKGCYQMGKLRVIWETHWVS